jgi:hypothetical protein
LQKFNPQGEVQVKKLHKALVGLFVALAVALPLGVLALNAAPQTERPVSIVRVASENTPTPTPTPFGGPGGGPCQGGHC